MKLVSLGCVAIAVLAGCKQKTEVFTVHTQYMDKKETWLESDGTPSIKVLQLDSKDLFSQKLLTADKNVLISWCTWVGQVYYIGSDGFLYLLNQDRAKNKKPDHPGARPVNVGIRSSDDIISVCDDNWPHTTPFLFLTKDGILVSVTSSAGGTGLYRVDLKIKHLDKDNTRVSWGRTGEGLFSDISLVIDVDGKKSGYRLKHNQFKSYHY